MRLPEVCKPLCNYGTHAAATVRVLTAETVDPLEEEE